MPVGWGVVGASGFAGHRAIAEGIIPSHNGKLIAAMCRSEEHARAASEAFGGVRYYTDSEDLFRDPEVDAVYICTPVYTHLTEVMKAAEHGKHVFCEKPLALNEQEARQMVRACREHKVKLGTAFMLPYHPVNLKLKNLIDSGRLGTIVLARVQWGWWFPPMEGAWRHDPRLGGGGALMDVGSHCIHLLEFLLGPAVEVTCFADTLVQDYLVEDTAVATFRFESGAVGIVDVHFNTPVTHPRPLEVYGTRGAAFATGSIGQLSTGTLTLKALPEGSDDMHQITETEVPMDVHQNMYQAEFESFAAAVENNTEPVIDGEAGLHNIRLIAAAYRSARTGRTIAL